MTRRDYCLHLNALQGQTCVQINVEDSGAINIEVSVSKEEEEKFQLSFKSDADIKGLIELLRWARASSLKAQGFKVVM